MPFPPGSGGHSLAYHGKRGMATLRFAAFSFENYTRVITGVRLLNYTRVITGE